MRTLYKYFKFAKMAMTLGAIVAVGVFFWPGALAAVAEFSLFGLSIAALVGPNLLVQAGAVGALTFFGLHALGIMLDVVSGFFSALKYCFSASSSQPHDPHTPPPSTEEKTSAHDAYATMTNAMPGNQQPHANFFHTQSATYQPIYPTAYGNYQPQNTVNAAQEDQNHYQPLYPGL